MNQIFENLSENGKSFIKSYSGARLIKKHKADEFNQWIVYGEDPNADFNGPHHQPLLGHVEGTLFEAIEWAVEQKGWFSWGTGGELVEFSLISLSEKNKD